MGYRGSEAHTHRLQVLPIQAIFFLKIPPRLRFEIRGLQPFASLCGRVWERSRGRGGLSCPLPGWDSSCGRWSLSQPCWQRSCNCRSSALLFWSKRLCQLALMLPWCCPYGLQLPLCLSLSGCLSVLILQAQPLFPDGGSPLVLNAGWQCHNELVGCGLWYHLLGTFFVFLYKLIPEDRGFLMKAGWFTNWPDSSPAGWGDGSVSNGTYSANVSTSV